MTASPPATEPKKPLLLGVSMRNAFATTSSHRHYVPESKKSLRRAQSFRWRAEIEHNYVKAARRLAHGNANQTARRLGIKRSTLCKRMKSSAKET